MPAPQESTRASYVSASTPSVQKYYVEQVNDKKLEKITNTDQQE